MTPGAYAFGALAGAILAAGPARAEDPLEHIYKLREVASIERLIGYGSCTQAVDAIEAALAAKKPHIMLLAGTMFEEGLCVKADWNKAAGRTMRAEEAHEPNALERLAAGDAQPGRDNGMALWWAARRLSAGLHPGRRSGA